MRRGREAAHVQPDLGDDRLRGGDTDSRDLIELAHRVGERGDLLLDPRVEFGDVGADRVDPAQHPPKQERVVIGEGPDERLLQGGDLAPHRAAS